MKITLLGTGTSQGVPVIGCKCATCTSSDPRDTRYRCSVLISSENTQLVIDVGPDFRSQMLTHQVDNLDGVLLTHEHNDHVIGLDDIRPFLFRKKEGIKIHAEDRVINEVRSRFKYAFQTHLYPGAPSFSMKRIEPGIEFEIGDITILPLRVVHGDLPILGFRIGDFAYLTDTNFIPDETLHLLSGVKILVLDALREKKHHSHFSVEEAISAIGKIRPDRSYLTHISHLLGPISRWDQQLPKGIYGAYDGLEFEL